MDLYLPRLLQPDSKTPPSANHASLLSTLYYHSLFDFPLTDGELVKWQAGGGTIKAFGTRKLGTDDVTCKNGFSFIGQNESLVFKRLLATRASTKKMALAKSAARVLRFLPTIRFVGITGSLAMGNARVSDDIDLMVITSPHTLWSSRMVGYLLLKLLGFRLRTPGDKNEKDKLCLNLWVDETALVWKKRNAFTAHEICQVVSLVSKTKTYEVFLWQNKWVKAYWPNAVKLTKPATSQRTYIFGSVMRFFEPLAFWLQRRYMQGKITNEVVTSNMALFHPLDLSKEVLKRF